VSGDIAIVHNGIVENYLSLKQQLMDEAHRFVTETDTEVMAHLIESALVNRHDLVAAVRWALEPVTRPIGGRKQ
jgi:glucosamine--fructose-6-phosphate aminotransferase (isomerizing)